MITTESLFICLNPKRYQRISSGVRQPAESLAIPPPRYRNGGYFTWVIDDATPVVAGQVVAHAHAHWGAIASDLIRQQAEKNTESIAELELALATAAAQRDQAALGIFKRSARPSQQWPKHVRHGVMITLWRLLAARQAGNGPRWRMRRLWLMLNAIEIQLWR